MGRTWRLLVLAAAVWPAFGQSEESILPSDRARAAAVADLTAGFNAIGGRASELRRAMKPNDADAFDAVMRDVMGALMALPGISSAPSPDLGTIVAKPRPDRIGQLVPDLTGMERFFCRLSQTSDTPAQRRIFQRAHKDVVKMLAALPAALPTVDVGSLQFSGAYRGCIERTRHTDLHFLNSCRGTGVQLTTQE